MKRLLFSLFLFLFIHNLSNAQPYGSSTELRSYIQNEYEAINGHILRMDQDYDYGGEITSIYDSLLLNIYDFDPGDIPEYPAAVVRDRLHSIPSLVSLDYNQYVQRYIDLYTREKREQVSRMLGLKEVYFTTFEEELDKQGLPMELKYLPVVESALNPHAKSPVGATGLWQFMLSTGKQYGLKVNSFVDERKDPHKATLAAIRYLKHQHSEFGDWLLAIAAYNCGPGNVRKAIYRSGGKRDFWSIRAHLPRETRGYVPAYIAAVYTFTYPSEHNLYPVYVDFSLDVDTLHIRRLSFSLQEIANLTNTDAQLLRNLNPELKLDRVPYSNKTYVLRVPPKVLEYFSIYHTDLRHRFGSSDNGSTTSTVSAGYDNSSRNYTATKKGYDTKGSQYTIHKVRSGEVVGTIAERYSVSTRQIARWNNLRGYKIKVGQKLKIYSSNTASVSSPKTSVNNGSSDKVIPRTHYVRRGDTLWNLSRQYGIPMDNLKKMNGHLDPSSLKLGQKVRLK